MRWTTDGRARHLAQVTASAPDDTSLFSGLVAVADLASAVPGHVVVRPAAGADAWATGVSGLPRMSEAQLAVLGPSRPSTPYVVKATDLAAMQHALTAEAVALLNLLAPRQAVHAAFAYGHLFVAVEQRTAWFVRLPLRLDEDHFVEMADVMDTVDALARR